MKKILSLVSISLLSLGVNASEMETKDHKMMMAHKKMGMMHTKMMECKKDGKKMDVCKSQMMNEFKMSKEKCEKMMSMMDESAMKMMDDMPMKK